MPSVQDAMLASLVNPLPERDILSQANSIKSTFSSWDSCMAKTYCKWPVIAAIIIAGLMILSVVWCIVRCACCGLSCCCTCFSCLKCCGDCCGACTDPRENKKKHLDTDYFKPSVGHGYQAQAPMMAGRMGGPAAPPPTYAQFEVGPNGHAIAPRVVNEDALPPMPSWDTASKKHVASTEEDEMELKEMDLASKPLMSGGVSTPRIEEIGPPSPYSEHPTQSHDYLGSSSISGGIPGRNGGDLNPLGTPGRFGSGLNTRPGTATSQFRGVQNDSSRTGMPNSSIPSSRAPNMRSGTNTPNAPYGRPSSNREQGSHFEGSQGSTAHIQQQQPFTSPLQSMTPPPGQNQYDQYFTGNGNNTNYNNINTAYSSTNLDGSFTSPRRQYTNPSINRASPAPTYATYAAPQPHRPYHQPQYHAESPVQASPETARILSPPVSNNGGGGGYPGYQSYQPAGSTERW